MLDISSLLKPIEWNLCSDNETYESHTVIGRYAWWPGYYLTPDSIGRIASKDPKHDAEQDYKNRLISALDTEKFTKIVNLLDRLAGAADAMAWSNNDGSADEILNETYKLMLPKP